MRAIMLRHGEAESNLNMAERKVDEYAPLTKKGREQIYGKVQTLGKFVTTNTIYASPYPRTIESAEIFASELGLQIVLEPRLKEIDRGDWSGLPVKRVMEMEEEISKEQRSNFKYPNGESRLMVAKRVIQLIDELNWLKVEEALMVSHNHPILAAAGQLLGQPIHRWEERPLGNSDFVILHNINEKWHEDIIGKNDQLECRA